jgi:hypothetical protein
VTGAIDDAIRGAGLPQSIEPPADLWPAIAARIADERQRLDLLAAAARRDIEPPTDLWPAIAARLRSKQTALGSGARHPLAVAASIGAMALLVALASLRFSTATRVPDLAAESPQDSAWQLAETAALPPAARGALAAALDSMRADYLAVQSERGAVERSLGRDPTNRDLNALWQRLYRAELDLAARAHSLIESFRGA